MGTLYYGGRRMVHENRGPTLSGKPPQLEFKLKNPYMGKRANRQWARKRPGISRGTLLHKED